MSVGLLDFFVLEASDYVDRLQRLVLQGRLQLQQREQRIERAAQAADRLLDVLGDQLDALGRGSFGAAAEQLDRGGDRRQGVLELVGDVGAELRGGLAARLQVGGQGVDGARQLAELVSSGEDPGVAQRLARVAARRPRHALHGCQQVAAEEDAEEQGKHALIQDQLEELVPDEEQLAQPAPPKPAIKWSSRSGFDELSHLTPTGELDGWGTSDLIPTGDTDTTREVAAVAPAPHPPEEPAPPPPAAPAPAAVRSAAPVPIDAGMWEGFATPPALRSAASELRSDGAPSFELETADTAPVAIVAPSSQTSSRRSSESPRPALSARRPPSSQSPARSRPAPHPDQDARDDQAAKDPKDAARDEPPSNPGPLASAAKPHDWTEDP